MAGSLFDKLANAENDFFQQRFLSPVLRSRAVRVRIANIIVALQITRPRSFQGWGVFQPRSYKEAIFLRQPDMTEKRSYLDLFPVLRLVLCRRVNEQWFGIPAHQSDSRFVIKGLAPVHLVEEVQLFDVIQARFDGVTCWFDSVDEQHDPRHANYLRESLVSLQEPGKLDLSGLTLEERDAYLLAYGPALAADIDARKDQQEERIKAALAHAGASYQSYLDRGDTFTIEYAVDGERHRSVVDKHTLEVHTAGICLAGGDRTFDLTSLVGVIRQGRRTHRLVRVGGNRANEEDDNDY